MVQSDNLLGRTLGEFRLIERLGAGSFGVVYRAVQLGLGRQVVVKVLRRKHRRDSAVLQRFMREAQIASRLDHPYAAHLYQFGIETDDGLCWIAMELVQGVTLDRLLRERESLSLEDLVPFFERVAEVVQDAHDHGIVHRDLKPSNMMVIERAGKLLPKLLDFGLAKLSASLPDDDEIAYVEDDDGSRSDRAYVDDDEPALMEGASRTSRTVPDTSPTARPPHRDGPYRRPGIALPPADAASGSPPYMSPEQWTASSTVGLSTDLYALGVIAYEALTGRLPYHALSLERWSEAHRLAPVPPLGAGFPPGLDRFFQRALAKRPEDRWGSALELAGALRAELEARLRTQVRVAARQWEDRGRPVDLLWRGEVLADLERWIGHAGAPQLTGLETEFVEASRAQAAVSRQRATRTKRGLAALGVVVALAAVEYRAVMQTRTAEQLVTQAEVEEGRQALLHDELAEAQRHLSTAYTRGDRSASVAFMLARALQPRLAEQARFTSTSGRMWSASFSPNGQQIVTTDDRSAQLWDAQTNQLLFTLPHGNEVYHAVYSAAGSQLVTVTADSVRIWNPSSGTLMRELKAARDDKSPDFYLAAWSPDGKVVAAISSTGGTAYVWDVSAGTPLAELHSNALDFPSIAFSADGRWLATGGGDDVHVVDTRTWAQVLTIAGPRIRTVSFDPTGPRLATGTTAGDAAIWEIPSGVRTRHLREVGEPVDRVAFAPSGELVVTASRDGSMQVWNAATGALQSQGNHLRSRIFSIEFDPTSKLVLAAGATGAVVVSDAAQGMPVALLEGPAKLVKVAHFDPSSRRVVGASWDGTARIWDAASPYRRWSAAPTSDDCGLVTSLEPDRRFIAIGCREHPTRVWDTARDQMIAELPAVTPVDGDFASAFPAVSAAGDLAAIARGKAVVIYELPGGRQVRTVVHEAEVNAIAFAASGRDLVSGAIDGSLFVTRDGRGPIALPISPAGIDAATILADGRVVAAAGMRLRVLDPDRNVVLAELETPTDTRTQALRSSADGLRLISVPSLSKAAAPTLWDLERYRPIAQLEGHGAPVFAARFSGRDRWILTAGGDGTARMWDETGRLRQTYRGSSRFLADATLDPEGSMVVAGGADGVLRFWDATSGRPLWTLAAHKSPLVGIHFEGGDLVTRGFGGDLSRLKFTEPELVIKACEAREACAIVAR